MRNRLILFAVTLLLAASCGVSRDADTAAPESTTSGAETTDTSADGEQETTASTALAPTTTAADGEVAAMVEFGDGSTAEVLHGELNEIVGPTQSNDEFVTLVYRGQIPPGFNAVVLSQSVLSTVLDNELSKAEAEITTENRDEARGLLFQQLEGLMATSADPAGEAERLYSEVPYLPFIVELQARQIALSTRLAAAAGGDSGSPCVRHILVDTEAEGNELQDELAGGADFAQLAIERSTGPSGPSGGELGCAPSANYVPEFAAAVDSAEIGEVVGPIETQFGWHVLVVESYEIDGDELARVALTEGLNAATVDVDERVGAWDVTQLAVIPAG